ncbi:MAG: hypothetical protein Q7T16_04265 [Candidatus Burarchaeum sp.]|nr:hypothetical protein [Candidatus Burarchaeum sp.]MDO8339844.1 hypothetical protein [Candidatus Burarchaeum sp.]
MGGIMWNRGAVTATPIGKIEKISHEGKDYVIRYANGRPSIMIGRVVGDDLLNGKESTIQRGDVFKVKIDARYGTTYDCVQVPEQEGKQIIENYNARQEFDSLKK